MIKTRLNLQKNYCLDLAFSFSYPQPFLIFSLHFWVFHRLTQGLDLELSIISLLINYSQIYLTRQIHSNHRRMIGQLEKNCYWLSLNFKLLFSLHQRFDKQIILFYLTPLKSEIIFFWANFPLLKLFSLYFINCLMIHETIFEMLTCCFSFSYLGLSQQQFMGLHLNPNLHLDYPPLI